MAFVLLLFLHQIWWLAALPEIQIQAPALHNSSHTVMFNTKPENNFPHVKRVKRDWVIPPMFFPENDRGPFPKYMVKIQTSKGADVEINYRLTGPGADEPPQGLFTVDRRTGVLKVTQPLDREKIHTYTLWVHAIYAHHGNKAEEPMELTIHVIDQNDNRPEFTQSSFYGTVSESAKAGDPVMRITATDRDDPDTDHAMIKYRILSQTPEVPSKDMFAINPSSGVVSVMGGGLDREAHWEYALIVEAADMNGEGLSTTCSAVITVTDSNDHAPQFCSASASASVSENEAGVQVFRFRVTDEDELGSANANSKYEIVKGNEGGHFRISTGPDRMEGVLTTAKELDFESAPSYILLVVVTNEAPFTRPVSTSTATLTVTVEDRNEPPMLAPSKIHATVPENAALGSSVTYLRAIDPDTARATRIRFKLLSDAAGWLRLDQDMGRVSVRSDLDRESHFVRDDRYSVLVLAYDNDTVPATGTGTLIVTLLDVNDHAPVIQQRSVSLCDTDPVPVQLDIEDPDSRGNTAPFTVELQGQHRLHWNIHTNSSHTVFLSPKRRMALGWSTLLLRVYDAGLLYQDSTLDVEVCQCEGALTSCTMPRSDPLQHGPSHLALALGAVFALLLLLLLFILRRRKQHKEDDALLKDPPRDNICYYDEEGGGEDDRDYDADLLHRGLSEPPEVSCTDTAPAIQGHPGYRHRPQADEDIGPFLSENLAAADADPCAPPYDSLLVFDFEGAGSEADSLSSLDSSDSERDQDFGPLLDWGPGFGRLADMYTGGMDDDDDDTLPGKMEWMSQQNMFLEGLHQVYMQTPGAPHSPAQSSSSQGELDNARIHRWFGAVVNTRLLLSGVVQVLSAVACILTTVIYTCVSYNCAVSMATPVWPSLLYVASGVYAMEVQRRANKVKIVALVAANIFSLVFGFCAVMSTSLKSPDASALNPKQRVGSYVAKGSSITFAVQCLLASLYVLFLCWRGLQRYSPPPAQAYSRVTQEAEDTTLLENMENDL